MSTALAARADAAIAKLSATAEQVGAIVEVHPLHTDADEATATELLGAIATVIGEAEDARKALKAPHLRAGREVDARFKAPRTALERVRDRLKQRLGERAEARLLAERAALDEAKAAAAAGDLDRTNEALAAVPATPVKTPPTRWTWEVESVDLRAVPLEYLALDLEKVRELIREAGPDGPALRGVEFKRKAVVIARRS